MKLPRLFTNWTNKTPPQETPDEPAGTIISACHVGTVEDAPLSPATVEELKDAWAELEATAKESGAIKFHACSRSGQRWQDDPTSVRGVAALLRETSAL